ncbi:Receptor-interacting serine/threonine-protein kinase 4 [Spatholobus suberectus]|nr:Receptor-interacting serine/threonine-protein kinase 4 [Spatholobus suberectus]
MLMIAYLSTETNKSLECWTYIHVTGSEYKLQFSTRIIHFVSDPAMMLYILQGLRPELPKHGHPKLLDLMQRCWEAIPSNRPSFNEITVELENLLLEMENDSEANGA